MRIAVMGLGYVGAVSGACLAGMGHHVIGVDTSRAKVDMVNGGHPPVIENGLDEVFEEVVREADWPPRTTRIARSGKRSLHWFASAPPVDPTAAST